MAALEVSSLSVSNAKGEPNVPRDAFFVSTLGIEGDRHGGKALRQISLLDAELAAAHATTPGSPVSGEHKENVVVRGLAGCEVRVLDRIAFGDALLEVTDAGRAAMLPAGATPGGACAVSDLGVFARIVHSGSISVGQQGEHRRRTLSALIITLSDRAHDGVYVDKSGPRVAEHLQRFCLERHWALKATHQLLADDAVRLEQVLTDAACDRPAVIITTGGTGIGPRDVTPDVVSRMADREIPGIMEFIRCKYAQTNPHALLSRGVAVVRCASLVYTLPGSVKAVDEYMAEITRTMEHAMLTLRGIDPH